MVLVDNCPTFARSCRRVSAFSGDNAWVAALRFVVVLLGSAMQRAYGASQASSICAKATTYVVAGHVTLSGEKALLNPDGGTHLPMDAAVAVTA
jgi:hypothetical protein